ncbi:hypothetical protein BTZ20_0171 [Rhodococcus sp. MTM3W5.2]|nr:hypothetical protein BTZ20_0171 [Rhodococcus sp. MTM3W5.2]
MFGRAKAVGSMPTARMNGSGSEPRDCVNSTYPVRAELRTFSTVIDFPCPKLPKNVSQWVK